MTLNSGNTFLQRARLEAERYGTDPWVFVRELLQNARDAGAHRVWFTISRTANGERVSCRDDGAGMTFAHARRYLFSLYASSKRGRSRSAGRFGIGFWSVLRFEPSEIVVRSRPRRGEAWQLRLDGRLEARRRETASMGRGTEVVLERPLSNDNIENLVTDSILRDAPWLRCCHRDERPVEVRVNGRLVRRKPSLPPPSLSFRRRGLRGIVGLGPEPRAEVFAHGFRVRDAATLDELLVETGPEPAPFGATGEGHAPRFIIDSRALEVLMARGDAREDRALRRLVSVGHRELRRLVRAELDRHGALPAFRRWAQRWRESWFESRVPKIVTVTALAAAASWVAWRSLPQWLPGRSPGPEMRTAAQGPRPSQTVPYRDLAMSYRGPDVNSLVGAAPAIDLTYRSADQEHLFAALWITGMSSSGRTDEVREEVVGRYTGTTCVAGCLEIELGVDAPPGVLRLPVATGHLVDPATVRLDGVGLEVFETTSGQPAVRLAEARTGRLRYLSVPGRSAVPSASGPWPELPPEFVELARGLYNLPIPERASAVADFVGRNIVYEASAETAARYREAETGSSGLFTRAAAIGAGDCDVQNSIVVAMLAATGVSSRLAVGWIGQGGRAQGGLHAWAEYRDENGVWWAADASTVRPVRPPDAAPGGGLPAGSRRSHERAPSWEMVGIVIVALVAGLVALLSARRWRRSFEAGDADDIVRLVSGAAVRPGSFKNAAALFVRRLLPLISGGKISLQRASDLAGRGRLACASASTELARRAARSGGVVLDLGSATSAAAAAVMSAVNLDRWQELLDRASGNVVTEVVDARLAEAGDACKVLTAVNPGSEMTVLDGSAIGLETSWVVVDEHGPTWSSVRRLADLWPARAALALADAVTQRAGVTEAGRQRCLSRLATDALLEEVETSSE